MARPPDSGGETGAVEQWLHDHVPDPVTGSRDWRVLATRPGPVTLAATGTSLAKVAAGTAGTLLLVGLEAALEAHHHGLPALPPLHDTALDTPVGTLTLWPRVPGDAHAPPEAAFPALAAALAQLHDHTRDLAPDGADRGADATDRQRLLTDLRAAAAQLEDPRSTGRAQAAIDTLEEHLTAGADPIPTGYRRAHGDLHLGNVLLTAGQTWVIDWDHAGYRRPGWDAATLWASIHLDPRTRGRADHLAADLDAHLAAAGLEVPTTLAACRLLAMSMHQLDRLPEPDQRRILDAAVRRLS